MADDRSLDQGEALQFLFEAVEKQKSLRNDLEVAREQAEKLHALLRDQDARVTEATELVLERFPIIREVAEAQLDSTKPKSAVPSHPRYGRGSEL